MFKWRQTLGAGGSHPQGASDKEEEERTEEFAQVLRGIRRMVEFLLRREMKLDVKTDVSVRRLERLEKENDEEEDEEREASLTDALSDKTKVAKAGRRQVVRRQRLWLRQCPVLRGGLHPRKRCGRCEGLIGTDAWLQVVNDDARVPGEWYRARRAWGLEVRKEEKDKERANKAAQQMRRAAALTTALARGMQPTAWFTRQDSCCIQRHAASHGQPPLLD